MVSLRRRRLLGLYSGGCRTVLGSFPRFFDCRVVPENSLRTSSSISVHPMPLVDTIKPEEATKLAAVFKNANGSGSGLSVVLIQQQNVSSSCASEEKKNQQYSVSTCERIISEQEFKRRKRHRRKHINNEEQCLMRGVYFKNMKWQAAIKVDKKQIHLGTVGSQEEAARLYDRAAFMCGREPNFELSEEDKQELQKYKWEEFLAMTRCSMTKSKRRHVAVMQGKPERESHNSDCSDGDQVAEEVTSGSDDTEQETSTS